MITTKEIAEELLVSDRTVRNWIDSGILTAYQFGNTYRIKEEDFEEFKRKSIVKTEKENDKNE